ncbi:GNAT family N-acetyltransferase [Actinoplanes sp. NPDC049548]|uniref:GNAT family N-acetyltransferase n=1 Tax=Actinoplanes sp. NPDC049548 TaxID=3155152 RepID=UPI00342BB3AD
MIIRVRRPADLEGCTAVLRQTHEVDGYPLNWPDDPHRWLTPPRLLQAWVAEHPVGVIAGHIALQRVGDEGEVEMSRLFVAPAARRRSIAGALMSRAVKWPGRTGRLTLTVTDENRSAAVAFYEAKGWRHIRSAAADWAGPGGERVTLRHYAWPEPHPRG